MHWGFAEIPFGRVTLTLANGGSRTTRLHSIEIVPALEQGALTIPAWDFYRLEGSGPMDAVAVGHVNGRLLVSGLGAGQTLYYRVFCTRPGRIRVKLAALNDPPGTNRYAVSVPGVTKDPMMVSFNLEDGSVSTQETAPVTVERGIYTIAVRYEGLSHEQMRALTDDFTVMTAERVQKCGLESVDLLPVGP
jgi:hypothetical protein